MRRIHAVLPLLALIAAGVNPTYVIAGLAGPALVCAIAMLGLKRARAAL